MISKKHLLQWLPEQYIVQHILSWHAYEHHGDIVGRLKRLPNRKVS